MTSYTVYQQTYPANYSVGSGSISPTFTKGQANMASGAYAITSALASGSSPLFQNGTAKIYDLRPIQIFATGSATKVLGNKGYATAMVLKPWGAFKNFTIFRTQDPDLYGYVETDDLGRMNNPNPQGASSAGTGAEGLLNTPWTRHYRVMMPPKGASYVVPSPTFNAVPAGKNIYVDGSQMEVVSTANRTPSAFVAARSLNVYPRPQLLNWVTNPNGTVSAAGWTGATQASNGSGFSCASGTATVTVANPFTLQTYTVQAVVYNNAQPVSFTISGKTLTTNSTNLGNGLTQIWATYSPAETSTGISLSSSASFNFKQVMVTQGNTLQTYFDGDSGADYLWETGGTPGLCRSYWYPGRLKRHGVMVKNLQDAMPLGMVLNQVVYATLPKPDNS